MKKFLENRPYEIKAQLEKVPTEVLTSEIDAMGKAWDFHASEGNEIAYLTLMRSIKEIKAELIKRIVH